MSDTVITRLGSQKEAV